MDLLKNKIFIRLLKLFLLATVFFFVAKNIYDNSSNIKDIDLKNLNYGYLFPAFSVTIISMFIPVFAWQYLLKTLDSKLDVLKALRIWFLSNLGRYVPGKIWQISGLIVLSNKEGVSKKASSISVIYSQIVANLTGLSLGLFLISGKEDFNFEFYIPVLLLFLLAILPLIIDNLVVTALKILKKGHIVIKTNYTNFILYVFYQYVNWLIMGLAFVLFINIFTDLPVNQYPAALFILPISWTAGLLAIFAPGGIGVREGIMTFYLMMFIDPAYAAVIPWIYRIWITFFEMSLAILFYFYNKNKVHI